MLSKNRIKFISLFLVILTIFFGCEESGTKTRSNTIIVTAEQTKLSPDFESTDIDYQADNECITVYITRTGTRYHRDGCQYLSKSRIPVDLNKLNLEEYLPCSVSKPTGQNEVGEIGNEIFDQTIGD